MVECGWGCEIYALMVNRWDGGRRVGYGWNGEIWVMNGGWWVDGMASFGLKSDKVSLKIWLYC